MSTKKYHIQKAQIIQVMLDGEHHWVGEFLPNPNPNSRQPWATLLRELEAEGFIEESGKQKACGPLRSDGRGRPRTTFQITDYGREKADDIIAAGTVK